MYKCVCYGWPGRPPSRINAVVVLLFASAHQTQLAALLNADADGVVLMVGEGMLALWAALKSVVRAGDTVVALG